MVTQNRRDIKIKYVAKPYVDSNAHNRIRYKSRLLIKSESSNIVLSPNLIWLGHNVIHTSAGRNPHMAAYIYVSG